MYTCLCVSILQNIEYTHTHFDCISRHRYKNTHRQLSFSLVTKNFFVKVQVSNAAIFSCRLTARMLEREEGERETDSWNDEHMQCIITKQKFFVYFSSSLLLFLSRVDTHTVCCSGDRRWGSWTEWIWPFPLSAVNRGQRNSRADWCCEEIQILNFRFCISNLWYV